MLGFLVLPMGCQVSVAGQNHEEVLILEIARDSVPCVGEMTGMCIQVRAPGETEWRKFYDPIEGFQHEEGTSYVLEVGRREVRNPPADGSAFQYRLIRIVEMDPGRDEGNPENRSPFV